MSASDTTRVFRHALRARILALLHERGEASPADMAAALDAPLGNVSYHAKVLHEGGWIELIRLERRGGGLRHVYRLTIPALIDDPTWEVLPVALRRGLTNHSLAQVFQTAGPSLRAGGFDAAGAHVDVVPLRLDARAVSELSSLLTETLERSQAIRERSDARGAPDARRWQLVVLHYALADPG